MVEVTTFDPLGCILGGGFIILWITCLIIGLRKQRRLDKKVQQQRAQSHKPRKSPKKSKGMPTYATLINGQQIDSIGKPGRLKRKKKAVDPWDIEAPHLCDDAKEHRSWEGRDPWD